MRLRATGSWVAVLVVALGLVATVGSTLLLNRAEERSVMRAMDERAASVQHAVAAEAHRYVDALRLTAGGLGAPAELTRAEFLAATAPLPRLDLPGVVTISFLVPADTAQIADVQAYWRARGQPDLTFRPVAGQPAHIFSVFSRTFDGTTPNPGGDAAQVREAWDALQLASRADGPVISDPYVLVRDRDLPPGQRQFSFVLAQGVYAQPAGAFRGWIVMGMRGRDFLGGTLSSATVQGLTRVSLGVRPAGQTGQASQAGQAGQVVDVVQVGLADREGSLRRTADVEVANRAWRLAIEADRVALPAGEASLDEVMLVGGGVLTLMLAMLVYVLATARSRAERKVLGATEELRQSREQLQLLLDGARDYAIFMLDPAGLVASWSPSAERLNGYRAQEILGQPYDIFFAPEEITAGETLRQAREDGVVEVDGVRVRKDGTRFWAHGTLSTTRRADGSVRGYVEVVQDISERKAAEQVIRELNADLERRVTERTAQLAAQAEQLREANTELESFSYSVSHDLRAPLRAVDGFAKMLSLDHDSKLDAEGRRYVARIRAGAQHMGQLIDGLLAFSRLQRQSMTPQRVRMRALVDDVWDELLADRADRDITLDVGELPVALGDPRLVRHVLGNLLGNAVKYTRDTALARIDVGFAQGAYFVRDNGAGFDMRYADKLFKVFQRLHRAEEYEGTGIGLALAHRIVQRHGGRMWAEGEPGRGATFSFTLPIEESDHEAAADESLVGGGQPGRPGVGAARV